jgi:orotate phosphoribosyltransferase
MNSVENELNQLKRMLMEKSVLHGSFQLASGQQSDFYVDSKPTIMDPLGAKLVGVAGYGLVQRISRERSVTIDAIGGLTMGADPISLSISLASLEDRPERRLQAFSVRKNPKEHGRNKLIEGDFKKGDRVVVVDDVATTGGSTLQAIKAVRESGGTVEFVVVLVDREEGGRENIEQAGVTVHSLFRRSDLDEGARKQTSREPDSENAPTTHQGLVPA